MVLGGDGWSWVEVGAWFSNTQNLTGTFHVHETILDYK